MDDETIIAIRVAKSGLWGGDPEKVLSARVDLVLSAIEYEKFQRDYEDVEWKLNNPD